MTSRQATFPSTQLCTLQYIPNRNLNSEKTWNVRLFQQKILDAIKESSTASARLKLHPETKSKKSPNMLLTGRAVQDGKTKEREIRIDLRSIKMSRRCGSRQPKWSISDTSTSNSTSATTISSYGSNDKNRWWSTAWCCCWWSQRFPSAAMCESTTGGVGSAARKNGKRRRLEESRRERHSKEFTLSARVCTVSLLLFPPSSNLIQMGFAMCIDTCLFYL